MCVLSWFGWKYMGKKKRETTISKHFRGLVPVPHVFWSTSTDTEKSVPVPNVLFWTSVNVLAIRGHFLSKLSNSS